MLLTRHTPRHIIQISFIRPTPTIRPSPPPPITHRPPATGTPQTKPSNPNITTSRETTAASSVTMETTDCGLRERETAARRGQSSSESEIRGRSLDKTGKVVMVSRGGPCKVERQNLRYSFGNFSILQIIIFILFHLVYLFI